MLHSAMETAGGRSPVVGGHPMHFSECNVSPQRRDVAPASGVGISLVGISADQCWLNVLSDLKDRNTLGASSAWRASGDIGNRPRV